MIQAAAGIQQSFRERNPRVAASFGGADLLFSRWWEDLGTQEPLDAEFIEHYSTNDRFLHNRLILPEEVPLLALPLVRHLLRGGFERAVFIERGARPWLFSTKELLRLFGRQDIEVSSIRVKAPSRETLFTNLMSVAAENHDDLAWLENEATAEERHLIDRLDLGADGRRFDGSRCSLVALLSRNWLDPRVDIPHALKSAVFLAGNLLLDGPVAGDNLRDAFSDKYPRCSPLIRGAVDAMIERATRGGRPVQLRVLLDKMNETVHELRGMLRYPNSALNALLEGTMTARWFSSRKTLFVDEISVGGGSYFAIEAIGRAFCKDFRPVFASVVAMADRHTFLDAAAADFFELKPLEDVPWLSPDRFEPVFRSNDHTRRALHRFPSWRVFGPHPAWWRRVSWMDGAYAIEERSAEAARQFERNLASWLDNALPWDEYPVLRRRVISLPELAATLLVYYLGCTVPDHKTLRFKWSPWLEARLESELGFCGRLQKPFFEEMDRLMAWIADRERDDWFLFQEWRRDLDSHRPAIDAAVVRKVRYELDRFENRMRLGLAAVERGLPEVHAYMTASVPGATSLGAFRPLFGCLQRMIR